MPKLLTALATATILMASSGIIWKAEATPMTNIGSLTHLTKSYTPTEKVGYWRRYYRRCYRRGHCGYGYPSYGYGYRPYGYDGYGYRPYGYYGYGYRHYGYDYRRYGHYGYGYRRYGYGHRWRY
jgi:hypothetical protein